MVTWTGARPLDWVGTWSGVPGNWGAPADGRRRLPGAPATTKIWEGCRRPENAKGEGPNIRRHQWREPTSAVGMAKANKHMPVCMHARMHACILDCMPARIPSCFLPAIDDDGDDGDGGAAAAADDNDGGDDADDYGDDDDEGPWSPRRQRRRW